MQQRHSASLAAHQIGSRPFWDGPSERDSNIGMSLSLPTRWQLEHAHCLQYTQSVFAAFWSVDRGTAHYIHKQLCVDELSNILSKPRTWQVTAGRGLVHNNHIVCCALSVFCLKLSQGRSQLGKRWNTASEYTPFSEQLVLVLINCRHAHG